MSHEIRTPMNGIIGFSQQLSNANLTDEKRRNFVKIIQNSSNQLMHIIDDILEISYLETKQVTIREEPVCLNEVFFELFSIFDTKAKENKTPLYFKKPLSDSESTIISDSLKLNKIVANLLENSLKFTSQGYIEFGYYLTENQQLKIYVKDTGIGIDPKKHQLIFERFSQAEKELSKKSGGLGLGLSIAKENVELLGGTIEVSSEEFVGTEFIITLPYNPVTIIVQETSNKPAVDKKQQQCTILIAEDEEVNFLF
jgi:signal transduction histidine kinase